MTGSHSAPRILYVETPVPRLGSFPRMRGFRACGAVPGDPITAAGRTIGSAQSRKAGCRQPGIVLDLALSRAASRCLALSRAASLTRQATVAVLAARSPSSANPVPARRVGAGRLDDWYVRKALASSVAQRRRQQLRVDVIAEACL